MLNFHYFWIKATISQYTIKTFTMKKLSRVISSLVLTFIFGVLTITTIGQSAPIAEPIFGGHIEHIDNYPLSSSATRVFISALSPNSMFYSTLFNVNTSTPTFSGWTVVPDLDANAGYGFIRNFAIDEVSGFVFASTEFGDFVAAGTTSGSLYTISSEPIEAIEVYNSTLFYEKKFGNEEWMFISNLDALGNILNKDSSLIAVSPGWGNQFPLEIHINPFNNFVYIFVSGAPPFIYKSSDPFNLISNTTTWSLVTLTDLASTGKEYVSMGIAPDGRLFSGSYQGNSSSFTAQVSYSDFDGDPWITNLVSEDCGRGDMSIEAKLSGDYNVYFSRVMSADSGTNWYHHGGADGSIIADPINGDFAYVRTDWGIGLFDNYTINVTEINYGLQAVQVYDWVQNYTKDTAWVASKSGIWHVSDYGGTSPVWSNPIWPQYHTTPWTDVECFINADPLYCGNNDGDVYKWTNSNGSFNLSSSYDMLFEAHNDAPYPDYTWTYGTHTSAIAYDPYTSVERIFIGLYDAEDWDETIESMGAVFLGENISGSWGFSQIIGSPMLTEGCDVNDLVVVSEGGNSTVYIGVEHNTTYGTVTGIYRIEETAPLSWTITKDLYSGPTTPLSATIIDLFVTADDTVYSCGSDASGSNVVVYRKAVNDTYWEILPISGLPPQGIGRAITTDVATHDIYLAVEHEIYKLAAGSSIWSLVWSYPLGTEINCIYYDDLLAGTSFGLFLHSTSVGIHNNLESNPNQLHIYPNPFREFTIIDYTILERSEVEFDIYDINGRLINSLSDNIMSKGNYKIIWKGIDLQGAKLPQGIYFYKAKLGVNTYSGKMILK